MALLFRSSRSVMHAVGSTTTTSGCQNWVQSQVCSRVRTAPPSCCYRPANLQLFSSTTTSQLQVLHDEMNRVEKHIQVMEIPDGFPFKIEDNPGIKTVALRREYPDEVIKVKARNGYTPETKTFSLEDEIEDSITLDICVAKPNGRCFELKCLAFNDCLFVESLVFRNGEHVFKGTYRLDGILNFIIPRYLAVRGMDDYNFTEFMYEYMLNKSRREYLTWLKKVKKFMKCSPQ